MVSIIVVGLSLLLNIVMFYLMFEGIYIPSGKTPFFMALITIVIYMLVGYLFGEQRSRRLNRLLIMSLSVNIAYSLSSLVYRYWKMEQFISPFNMMKISLITLVVIILYLNIVYIRAEISYKRKRGNQRIQKEPKKSQFEKWRERRKKKSSEEEEIEILLGNSTESEEKPPPI